MDEPSGTGSGGFALSSSLLLCHEKESCLNEEVEEDNDLENNAGTRRSTHDPRCVAVGDDDGEYVSELVRRETHRFGSEPPETTSSCAGWLKRERLSAVDWIISTGTNFGFRHQTMYLGIFYFDLFISRRSIDESKSWAFRLLSVACLSLAVKMEECRVPGLSEFRLEDYAFEAKVIQRMELLVLTTLEWKMNLITPFDYLHFFDSKFSKDESSANGLALRISESLITITKEMSLMEHKSWVVSAAAVLSESDRRLTREDLCTKFDSITWWMPSENENVYLCYRKMQEMEEKRKRTPEPEVPIFRERLSVHSGEEEACVASKRRLSFEVSDQSSPAKKAHLGD